jgi:glutaredoxin
MNKKKSALSAIIILLVLVVVVSIFISKRQTGTEQKTSSDNGPILFYSLSCPHCQNVEKYIQENNIKNKYSFSQLEVSANKQNREILGAKAKICGLDTQSLGVPFLWTGEKCLLGDTDIIDFFSK